MKPHTQRRLSSIGLLLLAICSLSVVACQASMETKQGALGEFCNNRDSDCRAGLICQQGVCVGANPAATDACDQVCERVAGCGIEDLQCVNDCSTEIENWGDSVIDTFTTCVVDDATCSELGETAESAAQTCYDRLPLADERADRCRVLTTEIERCQPNVDTAYFQSECIYRARTASAQRWSNTDECIDSTDLGECASTLECVNDVFDLDAEHAFDTDSFDQPDVGGNTQDFDAGPSVVDAGQPG